MCALVNTLAPRDTSLHWCVVCGESLDTSRDLLDLVCLRCPSCEFCILVVTVTAPCQRPPASPSVRDGSQFETGPFETAAGEVHRRRTLEHPPGSLSLPAAVRWRVP